MCACLRQHQMAAPRAMPNKFACEAIHYATKGGKDDWASVSCNQATNHKKHMTSLMIVKHRLEEGLEPMQLAQDDMYFEIVMKNLSFFERYAVHVKPQTDHPKRDAESQEGNEVVVY